MIPAELAAAGVTQEHLDFFQDSDPAKFVAALNAMVDTVNSVNALMMPLYYNMHPEELLVWLEAIDATVNLGANFSPQVQAALRTYQRHRVPPEYVAALRGKRHPVRGSGQIAGYWDHGISAEYAAGCDWSFKTDAIKQFESLGIPAHWTGRLRHMSNFPEWVEVFWECRMDLYYAAALWAKNAQKGADCSYEDIATCWTAEVPLDYALLTLPWMEHETVVAGWQNGIAAEYLLEMAQP